MVYLVPTRSTLDAEGAAKLLHKHVLSLHGLTRVITFDRDPRFMGEGPLQDDQAQDKVNNVHCIPLGE